MFTNGVHFIRCFRELMNTDTFKKQLKTHLFKALSLPMNDEYDIVNAPLVT